MQVTSYAARSVPPRIHASQRMAMNEDTGDVSETSGMPQPDAGPPQLTQGQLARLAGYGVPQDVRIRDVVFRPGDPAYDLIVIEAGRIEIVSPARRDLLRASPAVRRIEIVGSAISADDLALRTYAARQRLPHLWLDADSVAGRALMRSATLDAADLPAIVTSDQVLRHATPGRLADTLGLPCRHATGDPMDLTIIGSGPPAE